MIILIKNLSIIYSISPMDQQSKIEILIYGSSFNPVIC